jgi:hypothetical protein
MEAWLNLFFLICLCNHNLFEWILLSSKRVSIKHFNHNDYCSYFNHNVYYSFYRLCNSGLFMYFASLLTSPVAGAVTAPVGALSLISSILEVYFRIFKDILQYIDWHESVYMCMCIDIYNCLYIHILVY